MRTCLLLAVTVLLCLSRISGQTDSLSHDKVLLFKHMDKDKYRYVKEGKRVKFWMEGSDDKVKGRIEHISANSIFIDGQEYPLSKMLEIRTNPIGLKVAKITGTVLTSAGGLLTAFGIYMLIAGLTAADECGAFIAVVIGVSFGVTGLAAVLVGGIPLIIGGKKFDLTEKWVIGTADLVKEGRKKRLESVLLQQ